MTSSILSTSNAYSDFASNIDQVSGFKKNDIFSILMFN